MTQALTLSGVTHEMDWNYSVKFTRNICLKDFIQSHFTLVTTLTPLKWLDRARDQGHRGEENQSSIHLMAEDRWFVLALWENQSEWNGGVLARHLHPMAYPGHRAGVTTDSSNQLEESVQLLITRNAMNHYGKKQRRSHRCHTRMHRMQNSDRCWKRRPGVSRYTTTKNRRNNPERLELMKFCP